MLLLRSTDEPPRAGLRWIDLWEGPDDGLIACWEAGRALGKTRPEMVAAAVAGELLELPWKGGVSADLKSKRKFGTLYYLAMWQGLRGDPLHLETDCTHQLTCTRTGVRVTYTSERRRWATTTE